MVHAHAFGPFDEQSLELAEGMTVITGPNESGKSSWHAAIYAALCGMRRGRGRPLREDEEFAQRHKPWDGDDWEVSCVIDLPDGRTVELRHDLSARVVCTARDVGLGTDVSDEIINDGAPDGAHWLGLERRAFRAVASIRQAQILSVSEHAGALQEYLQRAAATAGTDETAATALSAIDEYAREQVGLRRANSRRPLMEAVNRNDAAKAKRDRAVADHEDWLQRQEAVGEIEAEALQARSAAHALETMHARNIADGLNERLREAKQLSERHPFPPPDLREDVQTTQQVGTAMHDWEQRPDPVPLAGPSARELEERLSLLPAQPTGDVEPAQTVRSSHRALLQAEDRHEAHVQQGPSEEATVEEGAVGESELNDLARELETPASSVDSGLREEVERIRQGRIGTHPRGHRTGFALSVGAAVVVLIGAGLLLTGATAVGAVGVGIALILGVVAVALLRQVASPVDRDSELRSAEAKLLVAEQLALAARERKERAAARAAALGLEPDPATMRRLADEVRRAEHARTARRAWEDRERSLAKTVTEVAQGLAEALSERGVDVDVSPTVAELEAAVSRYEDECRLRREEAAVARERPGIEQALEARIRAEAKLVEDVERVELARRMLRDAALAAGVADEDAAVGSLEAELVARLGSWQQQREQRREEADRARNEWSRLQALLDGGTLDELETRARASQERAEVLSSLLDENLTSVLSLGDDPDRKVRESREHAEELERDVAAARRELEVRAEQVLSVPEAEEQLEAAERTLARVESLAEVLETTKGFLAAAQERVHRDIAPVLAAKLRDRLARVTDGRYVEVSVDPETLKVQVREARGHWRNAEFLSHGTAEQIYLLLRIAMAQILTTAGANCPLLIDDSTVQSDPQRTQAILDVFREVSNEHQVILFSQEDDVVTWAQANLGPRDRLHSLAVAPLE